MISFQESQAEDYHEYDHLRDELKVKIDRRDDCRLVAALPKDEFRKQRFPGAINLAPDYAKGFAAHSEKDADIIVYCATSTCTALENVAREFVEQVYRRVRRYVEGKKDWIEANLPTEANNKRSAQRVYDSYSQSRRAATNRRFCWIISYKEI